MACQPTVADAVNRQLSGARLRVLIVGAGIAGATLAALLRKRGEPAPSPATCSRTAPPRPRCATG